MVSMLSLALPILLSAVAVFIVSSLIHMVLGYHRNDFRKLSQEVELQDTLRRFDVPSGDYMVPYAGTMAEMKDPAYLERRKLGPVVIMTVIREGTEGMGKNLMLWFLYSLVVSLIAAYIAGRALGPGADYLSVFRFAGTTAFVGYALALAQNSIWYRRNWGATLRSMFDGLIYALITAGFFGWLWPQ